MPLNKNGAWCIWGKTKPSALQHWNKKESWMANRNHRRLTHRCSHFATVCSSGPSWSQRLSVRRVIFCSLFYRNGIGIWEFCNFALFPLHFGIVRSSFFTGEVKSKMEIKNWRSFFSLQFLLLQTGKKCCPWFSTGNKLKSWGMSLNRRSAV